MIQSIMKAPERKEPESSTETVPGLTITATPIGNLADLSPRARESLCAADVIACEDTRHTGRMLAKLGIKHGRLVSYHDHSSPAMRQKLIRAMQSGKAVTLVSDAGTPLIADPGYKLVEQCRHEGIPVRAIPGPSAFLAALVISGFPTDRFYFSGFLPISPARRQKLLMKLLQIDASIIAYETANRLPDTLTELATLEPTRKVFIARELTKLFEESRCDSADRLAAHFAEAGAPRGEVVLILAPPHHAAGEIEDDELIRLLESELAAGTSRRDAIRNVSDRTGIGRSRIYDLAVTLEGDD